MRFCPKCGDYYADGLLAFCLADGTPLVEVDPSGDTWNDGVRVIEQKQNALKTQQRRLKWRRVMLSAMLMATMVVTVVTVKSSFSVTVIPPKGEVCIRTFNDLNGNGKQDDGEPGLPVFVFQVLGTDPATTLTTDTKGGVCSDFPVGEYTVVEQPQSGWIATTQTTQKLTVTAGQTANALFGSRQEKSKLCITKFNDLNGNGKQDDGEPGLSGFVFQVLGTDPAKTLTTDPKGGVCSDFPVGEYTVVEQPQNGWTPTTPTTRTVTLTAQGSNMVFGSRQEKGKLCIRTFNDLNDNGQPEPNQPGLSGFVFQVRGTGPATTLTTGPTGDICSTLPVGTYTVVEQPHSGWVATTPTTQTVTVTAGPAAKVPFGNRQERGELGIQAFNDLNGNGVRERDEPGLSGFVFQVSGKGVATTLTTGPNGVSDAVLPVGNYTVVEQTHSGWTPTTPTTQSVTVTAGPAAKVPFGNRQARGELRIQAFNDLNGNGVRERNEPGLSGFVFQVTGTDSVKTLTTGPNGVSSAVLLVGTYTVMERPKEGWTATTRTTQTVAVTAGPVANVSFGNMNRANADTVCSDADKTREWEIIIDRYGGVWRKNIKGERSKIIAENVPGDGKNGEASLGPIEYKTAFSKKCTTAVVTANYAWQIHSPRGVVLVRKERRFDCEKTGGGWICGSS